MPPTSRQEPPRSDLDTPDRRGVFRTTVRACIDLLAIGHGETVAIQVTSKGHLSERRHKIEEAEAYPEMIRSGWRVVLHGWFKEGNRWQLKEVEL
jgi:hypothetical protein